jgi:hypothetical protein
MLKSNLNLTNRSTNDLMREFNVFLIKLQAFNRAADKHTEDALIELLKDDCNGWINFFDRPVPEMAKQLLVEDAEEMQRIMKEQNKKRK